MNNLTRWMAATASSLTLIVSAHALVNAQTQPDCDPRVEAANLEVLQRYIRDLTTTQGNFDRTLYWSSQATLDVPAALPYGGTYTFDRFGVYERALMQTWRFDPTVNASAPQLYPSCDKVFLQGVWDRAVAATGKNVRQPIVEIFTFKDGKIVNDTFFFFDVQAVVAALKE